MTEAVSPDQVPVCGTKRSLSVIVISQPPSRTNSLLNITSLVLNGYFKDFAIPDETVDIF